MAPEPRRNALRPHGIRPPQEPRAEGIAAPLTPLTSLTPLTPLSPLSPPVPPYVVKRSRRKTLCLVVRPDGIVEVRSPLRLQQGRIDAFVREKAGWIERKLQVRDAQVMVPLPGPAEYPGLAKAAAALVTRLMARFAPLRPARIGIGRQKSRWGSCNSRGQIRFNACLARLPEPLAEYVVAHELCHLVHLNHSSRFYAMLEQLLPDARQRQRDLKRYRLVDPAGREGLASPFGSDGLMD